MAFYSVSQAGEQITVLESDREKEGYPWSVALPAGSMLQDLEVAVQSTQVAIDSRGVIVNRKGFGQGNEDAWRETFQALAASAQ